MVDFPEADRPVNHRVKPDWWRREERAGWVKVWACQVMLLHSFNWGHTVGQDAAGSMESAHTLP